MDKEAGELRIPPLKRPSPQLCNSQIPIIMNEEQLKMSILSAQVFALKKTLITSPEAIEKFNKYLGDFEFQETFNANPEDVNKYNDMIKKFKVD